MIPEGARITFLNGSEILMGDVLLSGTTCLSVAVTDNEGWKSHHAVRVENISEIFVDKVYSIIITNPNDGKTRAKPFYVKEQAESYHRKAFEHPNWIVSWAEHTISSWVVFQKSKW